MTFAVVHSDPTQKAGLAKIHESRQRYLDGLDMDRHLELTQSSENTLPAEQGCLLFTQDVSWTCERLGATHSFLVRQQVPSILDEKEDLHILPITDVMSCYLHVWLLQWKV